MRVRRIAALALGASLAAGSARASAPLTLPADGTADGGRVLRWDPSRYLDAAIPYSIQPDSPPGANPIDPPGSGADDRIAAVRAAFAAWQDVPGAALRYRFLGTTADTNAFDLQNVVSFAPVNFSFPPSFPGGVFPILTFALHAGPVALPGGSTFDARFAGEILDVDVVVNPQGVFTLETSGPPPLSTFDLQGVLTHEIGHLAGLDHEGVAGATMYGFFTPSGGFYERTLEDADRIALASLYPEPSFLAGTGRVAGQVTQSGVGPVFGAHVLAIARATGVVAASAMTGLSGVGADGMPERFAAGSGSFVLTGLPPGVYDLVAEPLDGPGVPYMNGVFGNGTGGASALDTQFAPGASVAPVQVSAGGLVSGVSIAVGPRSASAPNLTAYAFASLDGGLSYLDPATVVPGRTGLLSLGEGENLVSGGAFVPRLRFAVQGGTASGVTLGAPAVFSGIALPLSVATNAAPGPRLLIVSTLQGVATFAGAWSVVPEVPAPDADGDGTPDASDGCPAQANRDQADVDFDGVDDACDDCPYLANPAQEDGGGVGVGSAPDGIGDACQCGDVSGDGRVTLTDAVLISRSLLSPPSATLARPELCDVGGPASPSTQGCTLTDAVILRRALLSPASATIEARCAPASP